MLNAASRAAFAATTIAFLYFFFPATVASQAVQRNAVQISPSRFDSSPPVREMAPGERPGPPAFVNPPRALPRPRHALVVDPVVQSTPSTSVIPATSNNFPGLGNGFSGFSVTGAPSDDNLAVGPNDVVQAVNISYAVFCLKKKMISGQISFASLLNSNIN